VTAGPVGLNTGTRSALIVADLVRLHNKLHRKDDGVDIVLRQSWPATIDNHFDCWPKQA